MGFFGLMGAVFSVWGFTQIHKLNKAEKAQEGAKSDR